MLIAICLWLLIGALFYLANFSHTDWSITRSTLMHFMLSYIGLLPIGILSGWFSLSVSNIFILHSISSLSTSLFDNRVFKSRKYVSEINNQLNKK